MGLEQPEGSRPEFRNRYLRRRSLRRRQFPDGLLVPAFESLFNNRVKAVIGGKFSTDADPTENLKENLIDDVALGTS